MFDKGEEKQHIIRGCLAGMLRELRCPLCLETFKDPITTTCGHSFCRQCIAKEINKFNACPTCHKPLTTQQLNTSEVLSKIVEEFQKARDEFEGNTELILSQVSVTDITEEEQASHMEISPQKANTITESEPKPAESKSEPEPEAKPVNTKQYRILQLNENPVDHINIPNVSFETKIGASMTHLVLDADSHNLTEFNQKYCLGVLYGCYIVNQHWLKICVEKNEMIPEDRFEIQGDVEHGRTGAPTKARKNREAKKYNLFERVCVGLIDDTDNQYSRYLQVGRGRVDDDSPDMVVCSDYPEHIDYEQRQRYRGKRLLHKSWIDDSIALYEVVKKDEDYIL